MTTRASIRKADFKRLLEETREIMDQHLRGPHPDLTDPTVQAHLNAEESLVYAEMEKGAAEVRSKLFENGIRHGLTKKEITVALLRPLARTLRPSLPVGGCHCMRCAAKRDNP